MLSNPKNIVKAWWQEHWRDVAIFVIIVLAVSAIVGFIRLRQIQPPKEPIELHQNP